MARRRPRSKTEAARAEPEGAAAAGSGSSTAPVDARAPAPARRISRRTLALGALGLGGLGALGVSQILGRMREAHESGVRWRPGPFGPLARDPRGVLDLPEGFSYSILDRFGDAMDDGYRVPARPDGMACFEGPRGSLVLLRNHENPRGIIPYGPSADGRLPAGAFDPLGMGGVTRVVLDGASLEKVGGNLVLAGTVWNCAGGPSPWGWLSCEENVEDGHGWVFACPSDAERAIEARPIRGYGRFRHEAVGVDPQTCVAYLTEDQPDSCVYRFVPADAAREPFEGTLEAMTVAGRPRLDLGVGCALGERLEIGWVPVENPTPDDDSVRAQAQAAGAAIVRRGEGIAFHAGEEGPELVLCSTIGGPVGAGQIFRLRPDGDGGELELIAQSESTDELDMPDNIVVSPRGHVFFCEDGSGRNHLRGIDRRDGSVFDFARNVLSGSELAGVCFSPDSRAMFVSIQGDGITLAITGPFDALG